MFTRQVFPQQVFPQQVFAQQVFAQRTDPLTVSCGPHPGVICRLVWDVSHDAHAAQLTGSYLAGPVNVVLRIGFVVILALAVRAVLYRIISRVTERAAEAALPHLRRPAQAPIWRTAMRRRGAAARLEEPAVPSDDLAAPEERVRPADKEAAARAEHVLIAERRHQRVRALGSILRSASSVTIFAIAGVVVLGDLGINLAPLLASAGVVGVAVGFGAQNLVRDYLTGIFMLLEDQYGVGDVITIGDATGTVEAVSLRTTRIRNVNGVVWHIRNGTIDQVGNESQGWARAVIDFPVAYQADLAEIRALLEQSAERMWRERSWRKVMLEKPEVWGAQDVSSTVIVMRIVARTAPLRQWEVEREMRARVKAELDAAGIVPPGDTPALAAVSPVAGAARRRHAVRAHHHVKPPEPERTNLPGKPDSPDPGDS